MKILFITSSSINGGAQKHIREMFVSLTKNGHDVYLAAPKGWLITELCEYKSRLYPISNLQKSLPLLRGIMQTIKPDITNTFILSGGIFGTLAWKKNKYGKLFVTVNNPVLYDGISLIKRIVFPNFYRWMSKYASAFLVKSNTVRDEVAKIINDSKPVLSIKNGIDFNKFDKNANYKDIRRSFSIQEDDIVITNVAVLDERKGQNYLIEAIVKLRQKYPVHLFLTGEGEYRVVLEEFVRRYKAKDFIHFLGRRSDINTILNNSNIFVLSSNHEGLPNSLMEAMAMGLPCIATDVGGVRQLITDMKNGIVVRPKSPSSIVKAIETIIKDNVLKNSIANEAYMTMYREYKQDIVAEDLMKIYSSY